MFNPDMTKHLAELSKISFTDEELNAMTSDMTDIIALMEKVCSFDAKTPPHTLNPVDYTDLRVDEHKPSCPAGEIIKNAKNVSNNSFTVPKVV